MKTHQATRKELDRFNGLIAVLLDDLIEMLEGPIRSDERAWVLQTMEQVRNYLNQQFQLEEDDDYLAVVLEEFPNWYPQITHLRQEHELLRRQFADIIERLQSTDQTSLMTQEIRRHLTDWIAAYRQHQQRESRLLHEAFTVDVGAGE